MSFTDLTPTEHGLRRGHWVETDPWDGLWHPTDLTPTEHGLRRGHWVEIAPEAPPRSSWSINTLTFGASGGWH